MIPLFKTEIDLFLSLRLFFLTFTFSFFTIDSMLTSRVKISFRAVKQQYRCFSITPSRALKLKSFNDTHITLTEVIKGRPTTEEVKFRNLFLRDACTSLESVDASTSQKTFSTAQLPADLAIKSALVDCQDEVLKVEWSDGCKSEYSIPFLERNATLAGRREFRHLDKPYTLWDAIDEPLTADQIPKIDYQEYMNNPDVLGNAVKALHDFGVVYLANLPEQTGIIDKTGQGAFDLVATTDQPALVENIASRIGYVKETFYGRSWNVISVPQAKNVAYTSVYLPLHMDLLYYESPPGVQLLHIIRNSTTGGESLFADSFAAATHVLRTDPEAYDALTRMPVSYHYDNDGYHYYYSRPVVVEDAHGGINPSTGRNYISAINYSPPFQGPLDAFAPGSGFTDKEVDAFLRGLRAFEHYIEDKKNQIEFKMEENCCVVFMNRRALHARNEFDPSSGYRWFRGTYVDIGAYQSRLRVSSGLTRH